MLGFISGKYDILREKDLRRIDKAIQANIERGNEYFSLAVYADELCSALGQDTPIKNLEDRLQIASYISGVDFAFPIYSLDREDIIKSSEKAFEIFLQEKKLKENNIEQSKPFKIGYTPGTYDLFHAGHLENLLEASKRSEKVIVGIKSDGLVKEHKGKAPIITAEERAEIIRHLSFVDDVYIYYTRDPQPALKWIEKN